MEITIIIKMDEGETIECPECGEPHMIDLENIAILIGECEHCETDIIIEAPITDIGVQQ